jgi:hypothetical protein
MTHLHILHADGTVTTHEATILPTGDQRDGGDVLAIRGDGIAWDVIVRSVAE